MFVHENKKYLSSVNESLLSNAYSDNKVLGLRSLQTAVHTAPAVEATPAIIRNNKRVFPADSDERIVTSSSKKKVKASPAKGLQPSDYVNHKRSRAAKYFIPKTKVIVKLIYFRFLKLMINFMTGFV
jgi:hypothetical protein